MSKTIDERVVSMQFDNRQFESNVKTTIGTLGKLKQSLNLQGASKGLENINYAAKNCNLNPLGNAVETVKLKFSALQVMAVTALANITNSAINTGKSIIKAFTIDPVKTGLKEYETQINAVQTILANTENKGTTLDDVNEALDTLNTYADKTIYNFTEMTRNIGTFTAAGIDLETSVNAIQGIANLAAVSGSNSQQASTAMYQLSQALASGTVKLMDWNSVVNAGMGGQVFQDALKETARVHGIAIDDMIKKHGSFRETLQEGWLTSEILTETLQKFTLTTEGLTEEQIEANRQMLKSKGYTDEQIDSIFKLGETATDAATKVKTFTQLMDTLKEAAQSGWTQTWELIIGDFEQAKELWTGVSDFFGEIINNSANKRNELLGGALNSKWDKMLKKINDAGVSTEEFEKTVEDTAKKHGYPIDQMIEHYGSLEEAIRSNAFPVRILDEALGNLSTTEQDLSKVTAGMKNGFKGEDVKQLQTALKDLGYNLSKYGIDGIFGKETEEAIKAFQKDHGLEVTGIIDEKTLSALKEAGESTSNLRESIGDLVNGLDELGGREMLFKSIKNVIEALIIPLNKIKEAWRETFGEMTSEKLYSIIEKFHNFSEKLKMSGETADKFKRIFKGIFSVLGIGVDFISSLGKGIKDLLGHFSELGEKIFDSAASFGDWLTNLRNSEKESGIFGKTIDKIVSIIILASDKIKEISGKISDFVKSLFSKTEIPFFDKVKEFFDNISGNSIMNAISTAINKIKGFIDVVKSNFKFPGFENLVDVLEKIVKLATNVVGKITSFIGNALSNLFSTGDATGFFQAISAGLAGGILYKLYTFIKGLIDSLRNIGSKGGFLSKITGILDGVRDCLKSFQDSLKAKILKDIAVSIAILTASLILLASIDPEKLSNALVAMGGAFTELIVAFKAMSKIGVISGFKAVKAATLMLSMSLSILILASAMKKLAGLDLEGIFKGLAGVGGLMYELSLFLSNVEMPNGMISKAIGLIGIAAALLIVAKVMKNIGSMSWSTIVKGVLGLASSFMAIAGALNLMPKGMISKAIGLIGVAAALVIIAKSLKDVGSMSIESIANGMITLGGTLAILALGLTQMKGTAGGSAALLLAAMAFAAFVPILKILGGMKLEEIAMAFIGLAGVLLIFGGAAAILKPLVPTMIGLAGAVALLGSGCLLAGIGVAALAIGVSSLAGSLVALGASGVELITSLIIGVGEIITATCEAIADSAPAIAEAFAALIKAGCTAIRETLPEIVDTVLELILTMLKSLVEYAPQIVDSLVDLILSVLNKLSERIPEITSAVVKLFGSLFKSIKDELGSSASLKDLLEGALILSGIVALLSASTVLLAKAGKNAKAAFVGVGVLAAIMGVASLFAGIAIWQLPNIAKQLSKFMKELKPFISGVKGINESFVNNIKTLGEAMSAFAGAGAKFAFGEIFSFGGVSKSFKSFIEFIKEVVPVVKDVALELSGEGVNINYDNLNAVINAIKGLSEATANVPSDVKGGLLITKWGGGGFFSISDLSKFTKFIKNTVPIIKDLALELSTGDVEINTANLNSVISAVSGLAEAASKAPSTEIAAGFAKFKGGFGGGVLIKVPGLDEFVSFVKGIAPVISGFALDIQSANLSDKDSNAIISVCEAVSVLGDAASKIPASFEVGVFAGFSKLGVGIGAAASIPGFENFIGFVEAVSPYMSGFALDISSSEITESDGTALTSICEGVKYLGEAAGAAPDLVTVGAGFAKFAGGVGAGAYVGVSGLSEFIDFVKDITPYMSGFMLDISSSDLTETDAAALKSICEAVGYLGEAANAAPSTVVGAGLATIGPLIAAGAYYSSTDLESFTSWIKEIAPVLSGFAVDVKDASITEEDGTALVSICEAATTLAEAAGEAPKEETFASVFGVYVSSTDLDGFLTWISGVIPLLSGIAAGTLTDSNGNTIKLSSIPPENLTTLTSICNAAKTVAEAARLAPTKEEYSGIFGSWVESTDIESTVQWFEDVYDSLTKLTLDLSKNPIDTSALATVQSVANAAKTLSESILNVVVSQREGGYDPDTLESHFTAVGIAMQEFANEINSIEDIDLVKISTVSNAASLASTALLQLSGFDYDTVDTAAFGTKLENLSTAINNFDIANSDITPAIAQTNALATMLGGLAAIDFSGASSFQTALEDLGNTGVDEFVKAFDDGANKAKKAAEDMAENAAASVENSQSIVTRFKAAGKNLVLGFAQGISDYTWIAEAKARTMASKAAEAAEKELDEHSPSKVGVRIGRYFTMGVANGIMDFSDKVGNSSVSVARTAIDGTKNVIARIADSINTDIDTQPTIRPVLDLSNVKNGAGSINGMFDMNPSIRTMSNVGVISKMMNSSQNGTNDDVVSAIENLGRKMTKSTGDVYNVNGITYDDGSNISDAVKTLVRAAKMERRR